MSSTDTQIRSGRSGGDRSEGREGGPLSKEVADKVRGNIELRLRWFERALDRAILFFSLVNGGGLLATVALILVMIQFRLPTQGALKPAALFAAGLLVIAIFHIGHVFTVRAWAMGRVRIRRTEEDQVEFVDQPGMVRRLFSHLQIWPAALSALFAVFGVLTSLIQLFSF